jgi:hypothetical protein
MTHTTAMPVIQDIMADFARDTGLSSEKAPRRYLWTDAFAVCNFLGLYLRTGDGEYRDLALRLVDQVHHVLGRHRADDARRGWISGLSEEEGAKHPTLGGLRIGKELNERRRWERYDPDLEWDRDGQYYHYLTKWMQALNRVGRITGEPTYTLWAMELARAAQAAFTYRPPSGGPVRMYWKMSIDLSHPLVTAMGQHDPLDGLITCRELQAVVPQDVDRATWPDLRFEIAEMEDMCAGRGWVTDDALGIGGLLVDAYRLAHLLAGGNAVQDGLLETLLNAALASLKSYARRNELRLAADYRLAFRELGLAIGLHAVSELHLLFEEHPRILGDRRGQPSSITALLGYVSLAGEIEAFWLQPAHRQGMSWTEHRDINGVMLATSLAPVGYLEI